MAAEEVLQLFDSYWFERGILSKSIVSLPQPSTNPAPEIQEEIQEPKISRLPTLHVRSQSDQFLGYGTSFCSGSFSPDAVMTPQRLQTVHSGKEDTEFSEEVETPVKKRGSEGKRKKLGRTKSLSELEFQELKGFMDLGFVFSEEDKDSRLVSIIPGLQRLGRKSSEDGEEQEEPKETLVSRPYLSEAWDVLNLKKVEFPMMNWKIPAPGNEMEIKDQLRFWAHTVASTVR